MKRCGREQLWPIVKYYSGIPLESLRKTPKHLSHNSGVVVNFKVFWMFKYAVLVVELPPKTTAYDIMAME